MNEIEVISRLKKMPGFFEVYHKTSFECYRNAKDGTVQKVLVEILDGGPDIDPHIRYQCAATTETENGLRKGATGNPEGSIDTALAMVHWGDLDK